MFTVVRVKPSKRGKATALLSNGQSIKVPDSVVWGSVVSAAEIVDVDGVLWHKSLLKEKKQKNYNLSRDLTGYDASAELELIKEFVSVLFSSVMRRKPFSQDEFDDVVSYCAEACVRRHVYEKYDPSWPGSYNGYLKTIVFNLLRDFRRKYFLVDANVISLNKKVSSYKKDVEFIDLVEATGVDVCAEVEQKILLEKLSVHVTRLDEIGTGLPGFTYKDLFDLMVNGESLDSYLRSFKFPRSLLDEYVSDLKEHLKKELSYMGIAA